MPIYEYECAKCGKTIEVIQRFSEKPLKKHEGCGGKLTKLISAAGFQFKGSGWYVTDYARKGRTDSGDSSTKDSKETSSDDKKASNEKREGSADKSAPAKAEKKSDSSKSTGSKG